MDKTKLIGYLHDRLETFDALKRKAMDKDNDDLVYSYLLVIDEIEQLLFILNLELMEEK